MWFGEIFVVPTNLYLQVWTPAFANFARRHDTVFGCYNIMHCALFGCLFSAFVIWTQELIMAVLWWTFIVVSVWNEDSLQSPNFQVKFNMSRQLLLGDLLWSLENCFHLTVQSHPMPQTLCMPSNIWQVTTDWPMCEMPAGRLLVKQTGVLFIFTCWDD